MKANGSPGVGAEDPVADPLLPDEPLLPSELAEPLLPELPLLLSELAELPRLLSAVAMPPPTSARTAVAASAAERVTVLRMNFPHMDYQLVQVDSCRIQVNLLELFGGSAASAPRSESSSRSDALASR